MSCPSVSPSSRGPLATDTVTSSTPELPRMLAGSVFTVLSTTSHNLLPPRTFNCAQIRRRSSSSRIPLTFKLLTLDASQPHWCDKRYEASRTSLLVAHELAKGCGHSGARYSRACATATGRRCGPDRLFSLIACSTLPPRMHLLSRCPIGFLPHRQCDALTSPLRVCFDLLLWPCPSNSIFPACWVSIIAGSSYAIVSRIMMHHTQQSHSCIGQHASRTERG
jgi:hypothetical protein